jgi:O-methyltransferase
VKAARDLIPGIDDVPTRARASFPEIRDERFWECYAVAVPFSLAHVTGFYNVYQSMEYIAANELPGDLVECGCFLGGIGIFMGLLRQRLGLERKRIWLYDTFEGPPDGETDVVWGKTITASSLPPYYDTVVEHITRLVGSDDGYTLVRGRVEETLTDVRPESVALLRLDTDFWSSTKASLEALYPRLVRGGVLIVDDYGMFDGARRATDEYVAAQPRRPLFHRIDGSVWTCVKP